MIAPPGDPDWLNGLPPEEQQAWKEFLAKERAATLQLNLDLLANSAKISKFDPDASKWRFRLMLGMAAASLGGAIVFLILMATSQDGVKVVTSGAVAVGLLLAAGFVNPLQTVERDEIFRRWSDMIVHTFLMQASDPRLQPAKLTAVADAASGRFTALATSYAALANKALESLHVSTGDGKSAEDQVDEKSISVTNPGDQTSKTGDEVTMQVKASGGAKLTYSAGTTLPADLKMDGPTGKVTGKISAQPDAGSDSKDFPVSVTVEDKDQKLKGEVLFTWKVTKA